MEEEKFEETFDSAPGLPFDTSQLSEELKATKASDWEFRPDYGDGVYIHKSDGSMRIDVSYRAKQVTKQLEKFGFKTSTATAMNGFYHTLRSNALLN